jgi:CheY-like chemotaxis protein
LLDATEEISATFAPKFWYGCAALAAIAKQRPDLILMDVQLPIMDGYTATSRIESDPALRSIPIIAVTSYALSGEEKKARAAGCDDYLLKPYSPRHEDTAVHARLDLLHRIMSASLIGRLGSSAFRLSTTAVSMSLAGSCFSPDSALGGPFHHGIRGQGGTIFWAAFPLRER